MHALSLNVLFLSVILNSMFGLLLRNSNPDITLNKKKSGYDITHVYSWSYYQNAD